MMLLFIVTVNQDPSCWISNLDLILVRIVVHYQWHATTHRMVHGQWSGVCRLPPAIPLPMLTSAVFSLSVFGSRLMAKFCCADRAWRG